MHRLAPSHAPVFLVNSRYPLACAPAPRGPPQEGETGRGLPYTEGTGAICRVPWPGFPRSPWHTLPDHQCRFRVRAEQSLAPRLFSEAWNHGIRATRPPPSRLAHTPGGLACRTGRTLGHGQPPPRPAILLRHHDALLLPPRHTATATRTAPKDGHATGATRAGGLGPVGPEPVGGYRLPRPFGCACRPRLRSRLTRGRRALPRNPWSSSAGDSHPGLATHACILASDPSTARHHAASTRTERSPTQRPNGRCRAFGGVLEPRYILGAGPLDQ